MASVLVTGGTGFLGVHCLVQLLEAGHDVRTTLRSPARVGHVREMLKRGGIDPAQAPLTFHTADLMADAGWAEAVKGCDYVLHVASPFPDRVPKDENELIAPAREGALRVLSAARQAGVKRVVMTSSFAAISYGHRAGMDAFTENDWTDLKNTSVAPYPKSKTLAERAAWDFIAREGGGLELSVINPVGIFGPVLGADYSTSILVVKRLLDGSLPGCPDLWFQTVDVRDAAALHLKAMMAPEAAGERFLATTGVAVSMRDIAVILRDNLGDAARRAPTRVLPNWMMSLMGLLDGQVRSVLPELGKRKVASFEKARQMLGWEPRSTQEAVLATARSLLVLGLVST
jgi:nucleoside-diphosphate-sugar epimerase